MIAMLSATDVYNSVKKLGLALFLLMTYCTLDKEDPRFLADTEESKKFREWVTSLFSQISGSESIGDTLFSPAMDFNEKKSHLSAYVDDLAAKSKGFLDSGEKLVANSYDMLNKMFSKNAFSHDFKEFAVKLVESQGTKKSYEIMDERARPFIEIVRKISTFGEIFGLISRALADKSYYSGLFENKDESRYKSELCNLITDKLVKSCTERDGVEIGEALILIQFREYIIGKYLGDKAEAVYDVAIKFSDDPSTILFSGKRGDSHIFLIGLQSIKGDENHKKGALYDPFTPHNLETVMKALTLRQAKQLKEVFGS